MAKKPVKPTSGSGAAPRGPRAPEPAPAEPAPAEPAAAKSELDDLEGELSVSSSELDELESRLNAGLTDADEIDEIDGIDEPAAALREELVPPRGARKAEPPEPVDPEEEEFSESAAGPSEKAGATRGSHVTRRGFGSSEWAALAGFALIAVVGALLFFKFLYAHPAPTQGEGLPAKFRLPLVGPSVRLSGAESGWRERLESDKARAEEAVLPAISLTLDSSQASSGFVRVEFIDPDDKIRGDIMILAVEGGRFKDGGRGEVITEGGLRVDLTSTVGFRSHALFSSYLAGQDPRWSVRVKEGPDSSNGPWTELGAALISNTKH